MSRDTATLCLWFISLSNLTSDFSKSFILCFTIRIINPTCTSFPERSGPLSHDLLEKFGHIIAVLGLWKLFHPLNRKAGLHSLLNMPLICLESSSWACKGHEEQLNNTDNALHTWVARYNYNVPTKICFFPGKGIPGGVVVFAEVLNSNTRNCFSKSWNIWSPRQV